MNIFEHPNLGSGWKCPVCNTNEDKPVCDAARGGRWFTSGRLRIGDSLGIDVFCDGRMVDGVFEVMGG